MRVLIVNKLYFPWIGGMEKTTQDIAEGLNKKENYQVQILVCQSKGRRKKETVNSVEVFRAGSFGILFGMPISFSFFPLFKELSEKIDILHIHHPFPLAIIAYLIFRPKAKLIVHYHSDILRPKIPCFFFKPFLKKFLKKADAIIVTNPRIMETSDILKDFKEKCHLIPSGIDLKKFELTDQIKEKVQKIHKKYGKPLVLFVGRLVYYKGIEFLIEAFKDIDAKLIIIGSGPLKEKLLRLAKRLGIERKLYFLSRVSDNDLVSFYHACDIFVLPSIAKTEAFGLVQLEAMACQKPVISTNLPTGVPWINQDKVTGLVVPPKDAKALADALNLLLKNKDLRKIYGQNAKERAKDFAKEKMIEKIIKLYQLICRH
jgi:rhamnosyl/mannosyltransferase